MHADIAGGQSSFVAHAMNDVTPSPGQRDLAWQLTVPPPLLSNTKQQTWPAVQSVGTKQGVEASGPVRSEPKSQPV